MTVFIVVRIVALSSTNAESASIDKSIFFTKILCDRTVAQLRYIRNQWRALQEIICMFCGKVSFYSVGTKVGRTDKASVIDNIDARGSNCM